MSKHHGTNGACVIGEHEKCPGTFEHFVCICSCHSPVSMNTQPCCTKCNPIIPGILGMQMGACVNPSCPCHLGQDWEAWVRKLAKSTNHKDLDLLIVKISILLAEQKKAAYELGVEHGEHNIKFDKAVAVNKGIEAGRKEGYEEGKAAALADVREFAENLEYLPLKHTECENGDVEMCDDCLGRSNMNIGKMGIKLAIKKFIPQYLAAGKAVVEELKNTI